MKEKLKKIPIVGKIFRIKRYLRFKKEYYKDFNFLYKNYMFSKNNSRNISYRILWVSHSIEKGMSNKNLRPFGKKKIIELIELINIIKNSNYNIYFEYNLALSILNEYKKIYINNKWEDKEEYKIVLNFLNEHEISENLKCGVEKYDYYLQKTISYDELLDFVNSRHSVRNYSSKKIKKNDLEKAVEIALKAPSACNRQMVKVYFYDSKKQIEYICKNAQGIGGFDTSNITFSVITYDSSSLTDVGERNQGYFNAGLFAMNYVNALHSLGIGSCFIQFANSHNEEKKIKTNLNISNKERIVVYIAMGYYDDDGYSITISPRKKSNLVLTYNGDEND